MTIERDFDRIARAWLDLGPNEAPDRSVAAILQAIETTPQVRRPIRWPAWRPITMTRITMLAVLAGTIAILAGALLISGGGQPTVPAPSAIASPEAAASPTTRPNTIPEEVMGGWTAASRGTPYDGPISTTILLGPSSVDQFATRFSVDMVGKRGLGSNLFEDEPGVLRFTLSNPGDSGCTIRDVGRYGWSRSADGQWLTLDPVEDDACPVRQTILAGTWQRNLGFSNDGGPGIAVNFTPLLTFTLPDQAWRGNEFAESDTMVLDSEDGDTTFKIWKDPDGFVDPCDRDAGPLDFEPGMDAFLDYFRNDQRFTVVREDAFTIDGHRAVEVEIRLGDNLEQPCAPFDGDENDRRGILTWASHAAAAGGSFWNGLFGDQWPLVVTEVDGTTLLFEVGRVDGTTFRVDRSILDSVRFLDTPPAPPAD